MSRLCQMLLAIACTVTCETAWAQVDQNQVAKRLVTDLWSKEGTNRSDIGSLMQQFAEPKNADPLLLESLTLAQMQHGRYRDAIKLAERMTTSNSNSMQGWIMRSWLDGVLDQYDRTMVDLRQLKKAMDQLNDNLSAQERRSAFEHAGRLVGYLQGPVGKLVNQTTLQSTIEKFTESAEPEDLAAFNSQRESVLSEYERLTDEHTVALEKFEEKNKADQETQVQTLTTLNQNLDQRSQQIAPEISRLGEEASSKLSDIKSRIGPVEQAIYAANQAINSAQISLQNILQEILLQESLLAQTRDPLLRLSLIARINQLRSAANFAQADAFAARNQLGQAQAQYGSLSNEHSQITRMYEGQIGQLRSEQRELERQKRRNLSKVEKLVTGPVKVTGKAAQVKNELPALTTYFQYGLEDHRESLLERLDKNN